MDTLVSNSGGSNAFVGKILQVALGLFVTTSNLQHYNNEIMTNDPSTFNCSFDNGCRWSSTGTGIDTWKVAKGEPEPILWFAATGTMQLPREPFSLIEMRGNVPDALTSDLIPCQSDMGMITFIYWLVGASNFEICLIRQNNEKFNCTGYLHVPSMPGKLALNIPPILHPFKISIIPNDKQGLIIIDDITYTSQGCKYIPKRLKGKKSNFLPTPEPISYLTEATTKPTTQVRLPWTLPNIEIPSTTTSPPTLNVVTKKFIHQLPLSVRTNAAKNIRISERPILPKSNSLIPFTTLKNAKNSKNHIKIEPSTDDGEEEFDLLIIGNKTKPLFDNRKGKIINDTSDLLCDFGGDFPCLWGPEAGRWAIIDEGAIPSFEDSKPKDPPSYPAGIVIQGTSMFTSDPLPCQVGAGKLLLRYWSNGNVKLQVCALGYEEDSTTIECSEPLNNESKTNVDSSLVIFEFNNDMMEPFTLNLIPEWEKNSKNEYLIIDELAYIGGCDDNTKEKIQNKQINEKTTPTTTVKLSTTTKVVTTPIPTTTPTTTTTTIPTTETLIERGIHYCDILNCNFNEDACQYLNHGLTKVPWTLRSKGYGYPLTKLTDVRPYPGQQSFISTLLSPGDFAILESPRIDLNQNNVVYFQYYRSSYSSTIRLCIIDNEVKPFRTTNAFIQCPPILKALTPKQAYSWQNLHIELPPGTVKFYLVAHNLETSVEKTAIAIDNFKVAVCENKQSDFYSGISKESTNSE
uniref:MAM domain-containing protein n=1 Tax=Strongyloides stercoralis TaxID=6248 RepID=A0A0K0EF41_STRER